MMQGSIRNTFFYKPDFYRSSREAFGSQFNVGKQLRWQKSLGRKPEYASIHILYLESKVAVARFFLCMLCLLSVAVTAYAGYQDHTIKQLRYEIEEGNSVRCDPGYISKIVDGERVICVMQRATPGMATYRKVMSTRR